MQTFTLTIGGGVASLIDPEDGIDAMPMLEGFGATNDAAVADLFARITSRLTFDGKDA
jgi:hypothetical protein